MKPYEKYKNSGIDGVGDIPSHWQLLNFRYLIDVLTDFTANGAFADLAKNVEYLEAGYSRLIRLTDLRENLENSGVYVSEDAHNYLSKSSLFGGEILLANVGAYAGLAWRVPNLKQAATLGPNMFLLKFNDKVDTDFAYLCLTSEYLHSQLLNKAVSSAQPKLNKNDVRSCVFILPTAGEQQQIVKYADYHTAIIDGLISKKETLIEKLKEKRQTVINEAITKGLDPNAIMKDSGIEWLREIPKEWQVVALGYLALKVGSGVTPKGGADSYVEEGITFIRSQNVHFSGLKLDDAVKIDADTHAKMSGSKVQLHDVLLNITGASIGRCCVVDTSGEMNVNQHVCIIRVNERIDYKFLNLVLQSDVGQTQIKLGTTGGNREGLTFEAIKEFGVPLPPKETQHSIVLHVENLLMTIEHLGELNKSQIEKLKEYRQSLISEAVTGKIDVRDWEPPTKN